MTINPAVTVSQEITISAAPVSKPFDASYPERVTMPENQCGMKCFILTSVRRKILHPPS